MTILRTSRRLAALAVSSLVLAASAFRGSRAATTPQPASAKGVYDFRVATMEGHSQKLSDYRGKVLLIVNTASKCGFTPQYRSLESLYVTYRAQGFEILAFPANSFHEQEPGTNAEIQQFCSLNYHTTFPLFAKIDVRGEKIAPLYSWLTGQSPFPGEIPWNFTKFLVARDGTVIARFNPKVDPLDSVVTASLESALATHTAVAR